MKQYIDKTDLVDKIGKRIKELQDLSKEGEKKLDSFQKTAILLCIDECKVVLNILDTIEVKEVDLQKEIELVKGDYEQVDVAWNNDFDFIARHFFELGLKAQTNIKMPNLDDIFIEDGIDPNSKQAKIFKESYYTALEKFKAQKGDKVMKANEAPKRLYLLPNGLISYCKNTDEDVEYIRTDAFIEKAEKYLTEKFIKDISILSMGRVNINFAPAISNFLKCMKGE